MSGRHPWAFLATFAGAGVLLDQFTKGLATRHLRGRPFVAVVDGFVELRYSLNRGAFFSLGADLPGDFRRAFFIGASCLVVGLILHTYARTDPAQPRQRWALACLLSGGVGNLIDRLLRGEVVDFMHLHVRDLFHWATFNVADVYIAAGLGLLILDLLRAQTPPSTGSGPRPETTHDRT